MLGKLVTDFKTSIPVDGMYPAVGSACDCKGYLWKSWAASHEAIVNCLTCTCWRFLGTHSLIRNLDPNRDLIDKPLDSSADWGLTSVH
jgi:hypothetical protein